MTPKWAHLLAAVGESSGCPDMTTYGYARVLTADQALISEADKLSTHGCDRTFIDYVSPGDWDRPQLLALLDQMTEGDILIVTGLHRVARSTGDLVALVQQLYQKGVHLRSIAEAIDTSGPNGRAIFHVFGALVEFEQELTKERTRRGLAAAKAGGRLNGRPNKLTPSVVARAMGQVERGEKSNRAVANELGVSETTWKRARNKAEAADSARSTSETPS